MTRSLPNVPLWPRAGRSGRSAEAAASSSVTGSGTLGLRLAIAAVRGVCDRGFVERPQPLHPREDLALAVVQTGLDVGREDEAPAGRTNAERDRDRVVGLVADRNGNARHLELLGAPGRAAVEPHRGLARRQPLDL